MRRWHKEINITRRNWRNHRKMTIQSNKDSQYYRDYNLIGRDPYEIDCERDAQIGRFRKRGAWDCGNTRCFICHNDKLPKRSKHEQELLSDFSFKEQLKDFNAS